MTPIWGSTYLATLGEGHLNCNIAKNICKSVVQIPSMPYCTICILTDNTRTVTKNNDTKVFVWDCVSINMLLETNLLYWMASQKQQKKM